MSSTANVVTATIEEARDSLSREHVLARLEDWRDRTHCLYDRIQRDLGGDFAFDRTGKHRSAEEVVARAGLSQRDAPEVDILRIERPAGTLVGQIFPRHLWIIGANGRLDVSVMRPSGGRKMFMLLDLSVPMSGEADWRLVSPSDSLHQPPFTVDRLRELLS